MDIKEDWRLNFRSPFARVAVISLAWVFASLLFGALTLLAIPYFTIRGLLKLFFVSAPKAVMAVLLLWAITTVDMFQQNWRE